MKCSKCGKALTNLAAVMAHDFVCPARKKKGKGK